MPRIYKFPIYIQREIKRIFAENSWPWRAQSLAQDILRLSDFYILNPTASTPWNEAWAQRATLLYFWPLNTLRLLKIRDDLQELRFFEGIESLLDFGAGPATASWVFQEINLKTSLLEKSQIPQKWFPQFNWTQSTSGSSQSCAAFSYSLTELNEVPNWALHHEAILIIEPSTQQDGRKLLQTRKNLLEKGYSAWAPCPHQDQCPLLLESKTDWCHDRVHIEKPDWFQDIEKYLPIKNQTLTQSYLAVRKKRPLEPKWARLVGDQLEEKGKTRQLICRGPHREFLSWMHRNGEVPTFFRGDRVILESFDQKSNELRSPRLKPDS
jgi:hypothetical protein